MRIPRIYTSYSLTVGQSLVLEDAAAHYLGKVLRMQPGRELVLFNGQGGEFQAQITDMGKKQVTLAIGEFSATDRESPLQLELAIGISRGERMDWVLQKATELGVTRITPLLTERTEVKLAGERQDKKVQHWQQILISACEQCQRNTLPLLSEPRDLDDWLAQVDAQHKFVLHHRDSSGLPDDTTVASVALLIGPEGGLSDHEIERARVKGFAPLTLGPRVLRTETAPIAAISLVQYRWGDL
ncbi:16S rRNA (uracil(1498)-N(3))-methyltransferase [Cellvibrio sp. ARAG 10.3]|uniref:16S rRNA (uracil(1498)-N(3))-methyltransferase n=1 Tax=Cellvibrio sp. ARAG 10.3 TaxID=3451358 RepID=UPI003F4590E4